MRITLYQFPISHYCEKIRWALDYKGIRYKTVNLLPGRHLALIKKLSGQTSVPVLKHGKHIVHGSSAILDYLDQAFPQKPLLPKNPELRAQTLEWERRLDAEAGPDVRLWSYHYLLQNPALVIPLLGARKPFFYRWLLRSVFPTLEKTMRRWMKITPDNADKAQQRMESILTDLRLAYSQSHFLVGEHFTRADLTACALFSPLFQPFQYPVPWPGVDRAPAVMRDWIEQHQDIIEPLRLRYAQYR
ncbi:MAG: glutathione S-transferase [Thalassobium sp.]|jgi:glutathione S-transferase|uniref:Glutathione S-transferase family protein n=1 Tax=Thalassolituus pacificus TaxID=2975440 RepID=A0A9X2WI55_9GAMM|nr:glutathione S-transferase family protein [Thalassolituus pacificus]MCT7360862.1 glutathione S-transferase family protein [Thalassolituus pacificus]PHS62164.1 MAG: glutathione S-transferase [Thalassobium sp.]